MPLSAIPAFKPAVAPIALGQAGYVLTSNGPNANTPPTFQAAGAGGGIGALVSVSPAAGAYNDYNPGSGWPTGAGRLDIDTSAGQIDLTGLIAGTDAQLIIIANANGSSANMLVLHNQSVASAAANRFRYAGDLTIVPGESVLLCYYGGGVNRWVIV